MKKLGFDDLLNYEEIRKARNVENLDSGIEDSPKPSKEELRVGGEEDLRKAGKEEKRLGGIEESPQTSIEETRKPSKPQMRKPGKQERGKGGKQEFLSSSKPETRNVGVKVPPVLADHWIVEAKRQRVPMTRTMIRALVEQYGVPRGLEGYVERYIEEEEGE